MKRVDYLVPIRKEYRQLSAFVETFDSVHIAIKQPYRLVFVHRVTDSTTEQAIKKLSALYPVLYVKVDVGLTPAEALKEGFRYTRSPYVGIVSLSALPILSTLHTLYPLLRRYQLVMSSGPLLAIMRRRLISHLPPTPRTFSLLKLYFEHTAQELGYRYLEIQPAESTAAAPSKPVGRSLLSYLRHALGLKSPPIVDPYHTGTMEGAGIIHKTKTYVTHTTLPHSQSALLTFTPMQRLFIIVLVALSAAAFVIAPLPAFKIAVAVLSAVYFVDIFFNIGVVAKSLKSPPEIQFDSETLAAYDPLKLPIYTILCPLYREREVLPQYVEAMSKLDWPKDKLDIQLLLEADDIETIEAARALNLPPYFRIQIVPDSQPKTKPKACNWGLAHAKGEYLVIYDAEDIPDPLQLKKAYHAFQTQPEDVRCLQAKLNYFNPQQNILTRLFAIEYSLWFDVTLPGLQTLNTMIPLGGTSNHFRTRDLRTFEGWDPFNVTEDADLGVRLFKHGYRTAVIDSVTLEEANSDLKNWLRQRSRWIKGYMQTFLVHMRNPHRFLGLHGRHALYFQMIVGGKLAFMLINPLMWLLTISYFVLRAQVGDAIESLYPGTVFVMAFTSLVFGNFLFVYCYMIGAAKRDAWWLMPYVFLQPIYWLFVSTAAGIALFQLFFRPHYWEKTQHGLHLGAPAKATVSRAPAAQTVSARRDNTTLFTIAIAIASLLHFGFAIYLGRVLPLSIYTTVAILSTFVSLSQIIFTSYARTVSQAVATSPLALTIWRTISSRTWINSITVTAIGSLAYLMISPYIPTRFAIASLAFLPILFFSTAYAIDTGYLSGSRRYAHLAATLLAEALSKGVAGLIGILTQQDWLVIAAFPIGTIVSVITSRYLIRREQRPQVHEVSQAPTLSWRYFSHSLLNRAASLIYLNVDVIFASLYLDPVTAGYYALLATVGKIVYFGGTLFASFINPEVARTRGNASWTILISAIAVAAAYYIFGVLAPYTLPLLYGNRAIHIIPFALYYTLGTAAFTLATVITIYYHAKHIYTLTIVGIASAVWYTLSLYIWHDSIASLTTTVAITGIAHLSIVLTILILRPIVRYMTGVGLDLFALFADYPRVELPPHKLRILIFNWRDTKHVYAGGAEVYVHEIARQWVKQGHSVTQFSANDRHQPRREQIDGIDIIRRGGTYTVYVWAFVYYLTRFRGKYDVIIDCENGIPFFTPLYARSVVTFLLVFHVHKHVFRSYLPFPASIIAELLESKVTPLVYANQKVITISPSSRKEILSVGISPESKVQIIEPGVKRNTAEIDKTPYPSFVYLGRLKDYKNVDIALKAFAQLAATEAQLYVAGTGEMMKTLKSLARELGISSRTHFLGRVSEQDKQRLLQQSWAALQPSSYEGWGLTVIEANAAGTPVIASNVPGLQDSVVSGKTGILVTERDVDAFAAAMTTIVQDSVTRTRLSHQARLWSERFRWDVAAKKFIEAAYAAVSQQKKAAAL